MSAAAEVTKLEALLERVQSRRKPLDAVARSSAASPRVPSADAAPKVAAPKRVSPTPMEQAIEVELDTREPEIEVDVQPALQLDEVAQTAPVGTPAPSADAAEPIPLERAPVRAPVMRVSAPRGPIGAETFGEALARALSLRAR